MNKFLKEFKDRGYFYQCTSEADLSILLDKEKIKAYIGFDCTAESLHVGSLLQIMCLRLLQKNGHQPIKPSYLSALKINPFIFFCTTGKIVNYAMEQLKD